MIYVRRLIVFSNWLNPHLLMLLHFMLMFFSDGDMKYELSFGYLKHPFVILLLVAASKDQLAQFISSLHGHVAPLLRHMVGSLGMIKFFWPLRWFNHI